MEPKISFHEKNTPPSKNSHIIISFENEANGIETP